jgi:hypothetical protein
MRPILLLLTCALALTACGDDDSALSAADYRKRANELCADGTREALRLDPPRSPQDLADYLQRALDLTGKYEDRFAELEPPNELESLHERALRLNDEFNRDFSRLIRRVRSADDPVATFQRGLQRLLPAFQRGDEINRRLKLDECLQAPALRGTPPAGPS